VNAAALNTTAGRTRAISARTAVTSTMSHSARRGAAAIVQPARSSAGTSALPSVPRAPNTTATGAAPMVYELGARPASDVRTSSSSALTIISIRPLKLTFGFQPSTRIALLGSPCRWSTSVGR